MDRKGDETAIKKEKKKAVETEKLTSRRASSPKLPKEEESKEKPNLALKSEDSIVRLVGPFSLYYRSIRELKKTKTGRIVLAEFLSTKQRCIVRLMTKAMAAKDRKNQRNRLSIEGDILIRLDHPYILRTLELLQDLETVYLVSELYNGGDLQEFVSRGALLTETQAATALYQVLSAINYSHQLGIVYQRLSLKNLVLQDELTRANIVCKLVPFDTFECLVTGKTHRTSSSSYFCAPEIGSADTSEKSDVWSCGVILSYLLTGDHPFDKVPPQNTAERYLTGLKSQEWSERSKDLLDLLRAMVSVDPRKRPSISDCLASPWLQRLAGDLSVTSKPVRTSLTNLRSSQVCTTLKEAVMRFIVSRVVKEQEINDLADSFMALDLNKDGVISADELLDGYRRLMPDQRAREEAEKVMRAADKDGNGEIDYSEFLLSSFSKERLLSRENLKIAFDSLDEDHSQQISLSELKHVFAIKGSEEGEMQWQKLIQEADTSGDGEIDFQEFVTLMTLQINKG